MKKNKVIIFVLFLVVFILNCRTMMLNQTAETIKPKSTELTVSSGVGAALLMPSGAPVLVINNAFQQRIGLTNNIEFQYCFIESLKHYSYPLGIEFNHRINPKFQLLDSNNSFFSISPTLGVYTYFNLSGFRGWSGIALSKITPTIGINIIGSNKFKGNICSIYYGLDFEIGDVNFYEQIIRENYYSITPDISLNFALGIEINKNKFISRHEFDTTINLEYSINNSIQTYLTLSYNFSIGGIIESK